MSLRLVWLPIAQTEANEATSYYRGVRPSLEDELIVRIEQSLQLILEHPKAWPIVEGDGDVRKAVLSKFPYFIHYRVRPDELVVLGFMHSSRRPVLFSKRMPGT